MGEELRFQAGYAALFARAMPVYIVNEIEPALQLLDRELLKPDELTVFDVGANTGVWSGALLQHAGHFIEHLHLFEPLPGNYERIHAHRQRGFYAPYDDKVTLREVAVSDEPGSLEIRFEAEQSGYASAAVSTTMFGATQVELDKSSMIEAVTLDEYAAQHGIERVHLLKIDVEGHEMAVLHGARRLLEEGRIDVVLYEFGTHQMGRREYFKDFWDFFSQFGYASHRARGNAWRPAAIPTYNTSMENLSSVQSLLATKPA